MNQPIKDLIIASNAVCCCQNLTDVVATKPSLDYAFLPINDLFQSVTHLLKQSHRVEMRGAISAHVYELACTHFEQASAMVESVKKDDPLYLQLTAVMHVAMMWSSKRMQHAANIN